MENPPEKLRLDFCMIIYAIRLLGGGQLGGLGVNLFRSSSHVFSIVRALEPTPKFRLKTILPKFETENDFAQVAMIA
jgi:hypothetical protein